MVLGKQLSALVALFLNRWATSSRLIFSTRSVHRVSSLQRFSTHRYLVKVSAVHAGVHYALTVLCVPGSSKEEPRAICQMANRQTEAKKGKYTPPKASRESAGIEPHISRCPIEEPFLGPRLTTSLGRLNTIIPSALEPSKAALHEIAACALIGCVDSA